jgi:hypothetical protein
MRIGLHLIGAGRTLDELVAEAARAPIDIVYGNETLGWDPGVLAALIGARVPGVEVGTAVTLTYPRHPRAGVGDAERAGGDRQAVRARCRTGPQVGDRGALRHRLRQADGTAIVWTTAEGVTDLIVPHLHGKEIALAAVVAVTDDPDAMRRQLAENLAPVGWLPDYRRHLDRQGLTNAADTAIVGDEKAVSEEIRRFGDAGVTELIVSVAGDRERTLAALR